MLGQLRQPQPGCWRPWSDPGLLSEGSAGWKCPAHLPPCCVLTIAGAVLEEGSVAQAGVCPQQVIKHT